MRENEPTDAPVDGLPVDVLIVDDDARVLDALRLALKDEPYQILAANSPEQALAVLARVSPKVVVSDFNMPHMLGTELLARVAQDHPQTTRVILTAESSVPEVIAGINDGTVARVFTKPCNIMDLALYIRGVAPGP